MSTLRNSAGEEQASRGLFCILSRAFLNGRESIKEKAASVFFSCPPAPHREKHMEYRVSLCTVFWDHSVWFGKQSDKEAPDKGQNPHWPRIPLWVPFVVDIP